MAIKSFKPYTPWSRNMTVSAFDGVDKKASLKAGNGTVHLSKSTSIIMVKMPSRRTVWVISNMFASWA